MFNIIKQNAPFPVYKRVLIHLKRALKWFLYKQWHETISDAHAEDLEQAILKYFDLEEHVKQLRAEDYMPLTRNPPCIRIRGLLMRDKTNEDEDE